MRENTYQIEDVNNLLAKALDAPLKKKKGKDRDER